MARRAGQKYGVLKYNCFVTTKTGNSFLSTYL